MIAPLPDPQDAAEDARIGALLDRPAAWRLLPDGSAPAGEGSRRLVLQDPEGRLLPGSLHADRGVHRVVLFLERGTRHVRPRVLAEIPATTCRPAELPDLWPRLMADAEAAAPRARIAHDAANLALLVHRHSGVRWHATRQGRQIQPDSLAHAIPSPLPAALLQGVLGRAPSQAHPDRPWGAAWRFLRGVSPADPSAHARVALLSRIQADAEIHLPPSVRRALLRRLARLLPT